MKGFIFTLIIFSTAISQAKSNIVGTYVNNGQTLSIQVIDDPANGPYIAGEIWRSMNSTSVDENGNKTIATENFNLICDGMSDTWGNTFGSCHLEIANRKVINEGRFLNFAISKDEANKALSFFSKPATAQSIVIRAQEEAEDGETNDIFIFEVNWQHQMVGGVISGERISE